MIEAWVNQYINEHGYKYIIFDETNYPMFKFTKINGKYMGCGISNKELRKLVSKKQRIRMETKERQIYWREVKDEVDEDEI